MLRLHLLRWDTLKRCLNSGKRLKRSSDLKEETLFIDDTEEVLRTAKKFGIRYILHKVVASSKLKPKLSKDFMHISDFNELM